MINEIYQPDLATQFLAGLKALFFLAHAIPVNLLVGGTVLSLLASFSRHEEAGKIGSWLWRSYPMALLWTAWFGFLLRRASKSWRTVPVLETTGPAMEGTADMRELAMQQAAISGSWPVLDLVLLLVLAAILVAAGRRPVARRLASAGSRLSLAALGLVVGTAAFLCTRAANLPEQLLVSPDLPLVVSMFDVLGAGTASLGDLLRGGPSFGARHSHIALASVAVAGLLVAIRGVRVRPGNPEGGAWLQRFGLRWFALITAVQIVIGFWFLASLPEPVRQVFLGGSVAATSALAIGVLLAVGALIAGIHAMDAEEPGRPILVCAGVLVLLLIAMSLLREQVGLATSPALGGAGAFRLGDRIPGSMGSLSALLLSVIFFARWLWRRLNAEA